MALESAEPPLTFPANLQEAETEIARFYTQSFDLYQKLHTHTQKNKIKHIFTYLRYLEHLFSLELQLKVKNTY